MTPLGCVTVRYGAFCLTFDGSLATGEQRRSVRFARRDAAQKKAFASHGLGDRKPGCLTQQLDKSRQKWSGLPVAAATAKWHAAGARLEGWSREWNPGTREGKTD